MSKNILVLGEVRNNKLRNVSLEVLSAAKKITNGGKVIAALFGPNNKQYANTLAHYGADEVYLVENDYLHTFTTDAFSQALIQLIHDVQPDGVILGHTAIGKDIAPRVATRLDLGLLTDVIGIEVNDDESPEFIRPIYAGKAFQRKVFKGEKMLFTIRPNNIPLDKPDENRTADIKNFPVQIKNIRTEITEVVRKTAKGIDLTEANIIVSGGRGVRSNEGFNILYDLAEVIGAAVGASRGACDGGFSDYSMQIGQTGKVVTPQVYIACGISGAIQHLAGMSNSKIIIAINKDPEAPIFKVADYGIVGDLFEVVPLLTQEFKKLLPEIESA